MSSLARISPSHSHLIALSLTRSPSPFQAQLLPPRDSARFPQRNLARDRSFIRLPCQKIRCTDGADHLSEPRDAESSSSTVEGSEKSRNDANGSNITSESVTSNETLKKLKRYGISGILSYGLLNTAYYLTTFLLVWFYFAPAPEKRGYLAAVERFLKIMAMVWAGSQVTKVARAGGALALAPFVDRGLSWFAMKYRFKSREKAFFAVVMSCFGLAVVLFLAVTLISA
ncbi:hypothetical protein SAY87_012533 [Trapa incisa]|uniref:Uncharacterized protein n=2 Tax=Trapa TaxID=22665 RepID=A0AAN7RD43_TRANT|nr:hypothetical protein SAY87_012533 [Trapa incisa]KAK4797270.1 hypothetical protein SAY86_029596 [Trapa natans]